jgi:hypothetical protein
MLMAELLVEDSAEEFLEILTEEDMVQHKLLTMGQATEALEDLECQLEFLTAVAA